MIARALAKSREQRYATCMDLASAAADAIGATSPASAHEADEPPPAARTEKPATRRDAGTDAQVLRYAGVVAGALLLVVLGAMLGGRAARRPATPSSGGTSCRRPWDRAIVIAAAGEIACASAPPEQDHDHCRYDETARLVRPGGLNAVLALGDNQYETGSYEDYATYYDPWWGQARSITEPVPGDREYDQGASSSPAGYFEYFGERVMGPDGLGFRSFNLPAGCTYHDPLCWHFIALNSELCLMSGGCGPPARGGRRPDPATRCIGG